MTTPPLDRPLATPVASPLITAPSCDVWEPVPFGTDRHGRPVSLPLPYAPVLIGGSGRSGRTCALRPIVAAAALDPRVRLMVWDGIGAGEHQAVSLLCHRYGRGVRGDVVADLVVTLHEAVADIDRRFDTLAGLPEDDCPDGRLTPALAARHDLDLGLTVVVIDDAHHYLTHATYGQAVRFRLTELAKVGPPVGYVVVLATEPGVDIIPSSLRDMCATRLALRTSRWQLGETILGAGSAKAGSDPSALPSSHKGVGWLISGDDGPRMVRTHFIDRPGLATVAARAVQARRIAHRDQPPSTL